MAIFWHLEEHDSLTNTSKFYRVVVEGEYVHYFWGRCGAKGQRKTERHPISMSVSQAQKKINEKQWKGYQEVLRGSLEWNAQPQPTAQDIERLESHIQTSATRANAAALQAFRDGKPDAVAAFEQWSQWGKGWEWMTQVRQVIEEGDMHWDKERDFCLAHINSAGLQNLLRAGLKATIASWKVQELDAGVLETAAVLWERNSKGSVLSELKDAFESAGLI